MNAPAKPADPKAIVRALTRHQVEYVVVGGWAAVTYGVDRATFDLDVLVATGEPNAAALARALAELGARRDLGAGASEELDFAQPASLLAVPLRAVTAEGPLDVLTRVPGAGTYEELRTDARRARFGDGTDFVIASKSSLEQIKAAMVEQGDAARGGVDRLDLEQLRALPDPDLPSA
jgi:hypothetical protein